MEIVCIFFGFSDTVRAFKERNKLGRFDPEEEKLKEEAKQKQQEAEKAQIEKMKVGDRCQVKAPGQPTRLGQVMHLGKFHDHKT